MDAAAIAKLARQHKAAALDWPGRGHAPVGYTCGMAVMFAEMLGRLSSGDRFAAEMARAPGPEAKDALAYYRTSLARLGVPPSAGGTSALAAVFVVLFGLGMRESSGRYCEGRDRSAKNATAATAEAGLFQTSWDIRGKAPMVEDLFEAYHRATPRMPGHLDVFKEGVTCGDNDWENSGSGDGETFQQMEKEIPAFAVEVAALGLRSARSHWGPIDRDEVHLAPEVVDLLNKVEKAVGAGAPAERPTTDEAAERDVLWAQFALNKLGASPPLDEDGEMGPQTEAMLRLFQQENGLPTTGALDEVTVAAIDQHMRAAFPKEWPALPQPSPPVPIPPAPVPEPPPAPIPAPVVISGDEVRQIRAHLDQIDAILKGKGF